jgi:hypothetical protein
VERGIYAAEDTRYTRSVSHLHLQGGVQGKGDLPATGGGIALLESSAKTVEGGIWRGDGERCAGQVSDILGWESMDWIGGTSVFRVKREKRRRGKNVSGSEQDSWPLGLHLHKKAPNTP